MTNTAIVYSRAVHGLQAPLVSVETHISNGLPRLTIVGLAAATVKESKDRVRSAILNSNFEFPSRRITINLAPADLPKEGGRFDLAIALSILLASGQLQCTNILDYEFIGELGLAGDLRPMQDALISALGARSAQRALILPAENAPIAALPRDNLVYAAHSLSEVCKHLQTSCLAPFENIHVFNDTNFSGIDMQDIQGQTHAKRALEIAAAGRHSLLLVGPPGAGKTMLACRLPTIMPDLTKEEALEVAALYSLGTLHLSAPKLWQRPFRAPHHTTSAIAMVGGGSVPNPGEISLAHNGVLFLDEFPEFERKVLEVLREPLETGIVAISRTKYKLTFPARFQLIAAMNPCPCGQLSNAKKHCSCSHDQILRYQAKVSGPLLERIDLHLDLPPLAAEILTDNAHYANEASHVIRQRVQQAMQVQLLRNNKPNGLLGNREVSAVCNLNPECKTIIKRAMEVLNLSARSFYRTLKVARTIADLDGCATIAPRHLTEALGFRSKLHTR